MSQPNSSTSNSDPAPNPNKGGWRECIVVSFWTLAALGLADVGISRAFPPADPRTGVAPGRFVQYFNYGWSVEAKVRRMLGSTSEDTASLARAGWLAHPDIAVLRSDAVAREPGGLRVSFYGMSFSNQVAQELVDLDPRVTARTLAGPAAPPSHSLALYKRDRAADSDVAVFAILASSVHAMTTSTGLTWQFEMAAPYSYPIYYVASDGSLNGVPARLNSLDEFRSTLEDPNRWADYLSDLSRRDTGYSPLLLPAGFLDHSTIGRMIRRAYAQRHQDYLRAAVRDGDGFRKDHGAIQALCAMVIDFAKEVRADGKEPVVLLIEDRGFANSFETSLEPTLQHANIPYLNSRTVCPATDQSNFVSDGHFTPERNRLLAKALLEVIQRLNPTGEEKPLAPDGSRQAAGRARVPAV
jgi:hypothetical protein